jgi:hypothetical protein
LADFCKACSVDNFGKDCKELAGLVDEDHITSLVICEGCGLIHVDSNGRCVSLNCMEKGKEGHGCNPEKWSSPSAQVKG